MTEGEVTMDISNEALMEYSRKVNDAIAGLRGNVLTLSGCIKEIDDTVKGISIRMSNGTSDGSGQQFAELKVEYDKIQSIVQRYEQDAEGNYKKLQSSIAQTAESIISRVESSEQTVDGKIQEMSSEIAQKPDDITLSVTGGVGNTASIQLKVDGKNAGKGTINLTGQVLADALFANEIEANNVTISKPSSGGFPTLTLQSNNAEFSVYSYGSDRLGYTTNIASDMAIWMEGGGPIVFNPGSSTSQSGDYLGGTVYINGDFVVKQGGLISMGFYRLDTSSGYFYSTSSICDLGTTSYPFRNVRATNIYGTVSTSSDRNKKTDITYDIPEGYEAMFKALKPCTFRYREGTSGRTHMGFIAQDVLESAEAAGLSDMDFAGYVKDGDEHYLRYGEFVAMNTRMIQKLMDRVEALEQEVQALKGETRGESV